MESTSKSESREPVSSICVTPVTAVKALRSAPGNGIQYVTTSPSVSNTLWVAVDGPDVVSAMKVTSVSPEMTRVLRIQQLAPRGS